MPNYSTGIILDKRKEKKKKQSAKEDLNTKTLQMKDW